MTALPKANSKFLPKTSPALLPFLSAILLFGSMAYSLDQEPDPGQGHGQVPDTARDREIDVTYENALPFSFEAEKQGLAVDDAEVARRLETYRKLYPTARIDKGKVKSILLAEAYLDRKGIKTGSEESAARFDALKREKFQDEAEAERTRQSLQSQAFFDREEVKNEGLKLLNMDNLRKRLNRPPPKESWSVGELQIPGNPGDCLAWVGSGCYVTVEEYNAATAQFDLFRDLPLDSARISVLRNYALAKQAAQWDAGDSDLQGLLTTFKAGREITHWMKLTKDFGLPRMDDMALRETYRKYHERYFRARDDVTISLIGSSDSAYIDSLHGVLARWRADALTRKGAPVPAHEEPALPWKTYKEPDLPQELVAPMDTFRVGDFTVPLRTPYGFFIVKLSKSVPVKETTFREALGMLTFLATRDRFLELDSLAEAKARLHYERHIQEFSLPDTLELRAWLAPVPADTFRFRPLRMSSLALPEPVRLDLQKAVRKESRKAFFGPFEGLYGSWQFQVKRVRRAEGRIPFAIAKHAILEKMATLPKLAKDTLTSDAMKDRVMLNFALARKNRWSQEKDSREQASREFEERLRKGAIDTTRFAEGEERVKGILAARLKLDEEFRHKSQERERDFLDRIRIDFRLLN